jgi:hypothetical protein
VNQGPHRSVPATPRVGAVRVNGRAARWARCGRGAVALSALLLAAGVLPAGASARSRAPDRAILAAGVLSARDVPPGWLSRQVSSGNQFSGFRGISVCKPIVAVDAAATKGSHAVSPAFSDPAVPSREATATDEVYAFKNPTVAARYLAAFQAAGAPTCLQAGLTQQTGAQVGVAAAPSHVQGVGDDNAGFDTVLSTTDQQGKPFTAILDFVLVRTGRAVVDLAFTNPGTRPLPQEQAILAAVVTRLEAARP